MYTETSVTYQFIGNVSGGGDAVTDVAALAEGAVALVGLDNVILTAAQAAVVGTPMRVAQRINGQMVYSPYFINTNTRRAVIGGVADTQQVSFLGYNGTNGQLDATAQATYTLGVHLTHTAGVLNNTSMVKTVPAFNAGGTQLELATILLTAFDRIMAREPRQYIVCERVGDDQAGLNTIAETLAVTNGATGVVASGAHGLATGDWVEIAGVLYQITVTAAATFTLDSPYKGATNAAVAAAAWGPATPIDVGLRFTGVAFPNAQFEAVTDINRLVEFKLTFDRVEAPAFAFADPTTITYAVGAARGEGTYKDVAVMEVYSTFNEGNAQLSTYPPFNYRRGASVAIPLYTTVVINAIDAGYRSPTTGQAPISQFNIYVRINPALDQAAGANNGDVLYFTGMALA